eukprot:1933617-Pyramimonas_sp.AAC.2
MHMLRAYPAFCPSISLLETHRAKLLGILSITSVLRPFGRLHLTKPSLFALRFSRAAPRGRQFTPLRLESTLPGSNPPLFALRSAGGRHPAAVCGVCGDVQEDFCGEAQRAARAEVLSAEWVGQAGRGGVQGGRPQPAGEPAARAAGGEAGAGGAGAAANHRRHAARIPEQERGDNTKSK